MDCAMSITTRIKEPAEVTECAICNQVYVDPRVLPCCAHTFCLGCVDAWCSRLDRVDGEIKSTCPICAEHFEVPAGGLPQLSRNAYVEQLVAELLSERNGDGAAPAGSTSTAAAASRRCSSCQRIRHSDAASSSFDDVDDMDPDCCSECIVRKSTSSTLPTLMAEEARQKTSVEFVADDLELDAPRQNGLSVINVTSSSPRREDSSDEVFEDDDRADAAAEVCRRRLASVGGRIAVDGVGKCLTLLERLAADRLEFLRQTSRAEDQMRERAEKLRASVDRLLEKALDELHAVIVSRLADVDALTADIEQRRTSMEELERRLTDARLGRAGTGTGNSGRDLIRETDALCERTREELTDFDGSGIDGKLEDLRPLDVRFKKSKLMMNNYEKTIGELIVVVRDEPVQSATPTLSHVVPKETYVYDVTLLDTDVFIMFHNSQHVEVFDADTLTLQRRLEVPGLGSESYGLAACETNMCVYVSDYYNHAFHRVDLEADQNAAAAASTTMTWTVARFPAGLSVNADHHVVVACSGDKALQEYTTDGVLVREIRLLGGVTNPWHAIQLTPTSATTVAAPVQYAVSQFSSRGGVAVVGLDGRVVRSYGLPNAPGAGQMKYPTSVAVSASGCILVADGNNNRIVVVDAALTSAHDLPLPVDGGPQRPYGLCLDGGRGRLYVGECEGCRLLVFDHVNDELLLNVQRQSTASFAVS